VVESRRICPVQVRAKKDFEAEDPEEYLSLKKGKIYWQISPPDDGWVLGCLLENPEVEGLFPQVRLSINAMQIRKITPFVIR
jgi:SH3 domain